MTVVIRQYSDSDLEAVLNTWEMATRMAHEFMTDAFIAQERNNVADIYIPNTDTWVAVVDDSVVGFIALMGNEVGAIFLDPNKHGLGIGKALMDKAVTLHGELLVDVFKANKIGRKFYHRYGFEKVNESVHEATGQVVMRLQFNKLM